MSTIPAATCMERNSAVISSNAEFQTIIGNTPHMNSKSAEIRNYILDLIESGELGVGDKLPGARQIAARLGYGFTHVQAMLESLVQCGILETISRSGTYVRAEWFRRTLPYNFAAQPENTLWSTRVAEAVGPVDGMRFTRRFEKGIMEIRVTHYLLSHHDEYHELDEVFDRCFPNRDEFFMQSLDSCRIDGKLYGIPLIFSPRVIVFNPKLFRELNCDCPENGWSWDDMLSCVRQLRGKLPGNRIFNWTVGLPHWINFVLRDGGELFDPAAADTVKVDSPQTIRALQRYIELRDLLKIEGPDHEPRRIREFAAGRVAMLQGARQLCHTLEHLNPDFPIHAVTLPSFPGGRDLNIQGADLFCVRRRCTDWKLIGKMLTRLLSPEAQNVVGAVAYGIPFRKSAALKSLASGRQYDRIFSQELPKVSTQYNIFSPDIYRILSGGIARLLMLPREQVEAEAQALGNTFRLLLEIERQKLYPYPSLT